MQGVFNWLLTNWRIVLEIVLLVVSVVLFVIKKKPINSILAQFYEYCLSAVTIVEKTELKGQEKLNRAIEIVGVLLNAEYPTFDVSKYRRTLTMIIENILSTPQKKGE